MLSGTKALVKYLTRYFKIGSVMVTTDDGHVLYKLSVSYEMVITERWDMAIVVGG